MKLLLFLFCMSLSSLSAMTSKSYGFSKMNRHELNRFAIESETEVKNLNPCSRKSLEERVQALNITENDGDFLVAALAAKKDHTDVSQEAIMNYIVTRIQHQIKTDTLKVPAEDGTMKPFPLGTKAKKRHNRTCALM